MLPLRSATLVTTLIVAVAVRQSVPPVLGQLLMLTSPSELTPRNQHSYRIPRSIFGTFLEPIGNSIYNGLWAQILQNPSFEDGLWSAKNVAAMLAEEPVLARSSELVTANSVGTSGLRSRREVFPAMG